MFKTALKLMTIIIGISLLLGFPSSFGAEVRSISGAGATFRIPSIQNGRLRTIKKPA